MSVSQAWPFRATALGLAMALSLSVTSAEAQTRTRTVTRAKFVSLVTSPLSTAAAAPATPPAPPVATVNPFANSTVARGNTITTTLPSNLIVRDQIVTATATSAARAPASATTTTPFAPLGFGGLGPAAGPTTFGDPNPSPSE